MEDVSAESHKILNVWHSLLIEIHSAVLLTNGMQILSNVHIKRGRKINILVIV